MELGKQYQFTIAKNGKGTEPRKFIGKVIQICDRHITFKEQCHGFNESFLKWDLARFNPVEVK